MHQTVSFVGGELSGAVGRASVGRGNVVGDRPV